MSNIGLPLNAGLLPYSCYPADPNTLYQDMFNRGSALASELQGVIVSDNKPGANDQDKLWIKTSGSAPVGPFIYYNGAWVWPHPCPAGGKEVRIWLDTTANLATYDGGDNLAAGPASGPMWQVESVMAGLFPVGVGTIQPSATVVNVNDTGGADQDSISIARANLPTDKIEIGLDGTGHPVPGGTPNGTIRAGGTNIDWQAGTPPNSVGYTEALGDGTALTVPVLPPYRAVYFIKRTSRVYLVG